MTAMRSARRFVTALSVAVSTVLTACGGSEGGPVSPVVVTPAPTVVSISMDCGDTALVEGTTRQCSALATLSDGSTRDVTFNTDAKWSSTGAITVLIGKIQAMTPGIGQVSVTYDRKVVTITVVVKPDGTPWDSLPVKLTEYERTIVRDSVLVGGKVLRAMADTIRVWVSPKIPRGREALDSANVRWKEVGRGRKVPFLLFHGDSASADVPVYLFPPIHNQLDRCAQGGPSRVSSGVVLSGFVQVSTRPECLNWFFITLAHELGHAVMGFPRGHIPGCNLMGYPCASWREWETEIVGVRNKTFDMVGEFVFSVPSGTKPINP